MGERAARGETAKTEGQQRREAPCTDRHREPERHEPNDGRHQELLTERVATTATPRQHRCHRHDEQHRDSNRHGQLIEEGLADHNLTLLQRLDNERKHRAEQDHKGEHREENVVQEKRAFTRIDRFDGARRAKLVAAHEHEHQRRGNYDAEGDKQPRANVAF